MAGFGDAAFWSVEDSPNFKSKVGPGCLWLAGGSSEGAQQPCCKGHAHRARTTLAC